MHWWRSREAPNGWCCGAHVTSETSHPVFRLHHGATCLAKSVLDADPSGEVVATLSEMQRIAFDVEPKEPDTEYRLQIGDILPEHAVGTRFRQHVEWPEDVWLESARGVVGIQVHSRRETPGATSPWQHRDTVRVVVVPSKLSEEAFGRMVDDLAGLSKGLLFDLVSKAYARSSLRPESDDVRVSPRSAQLELRLLEQVLRDVGYALLEISRQPHTTLQVERVMGAWTGAERLSDDGVAWLLARGVDPRRRDVFSGSVSAPRLNIRPHSHCPEHAVIRWFLDLIRERAYECARRAILERQALVADKPHRSRHFDNEPSLYELFDLPRIERLNQAVKRASSIDQTISGMLRLPFVQREQPTAPQTPSPLFRYVESYNRFWSAMQAYIRHASLLLEHGLDERSKPTWRMYEQWVFLQLAAGLERIGLRPSSQDSLFRRLGTHLFTVDLRRGTRLGFSTSDGRLVILRYEPWIYARDIARRNGDRVFRGRDGEAPWSPDVLMEVYEPTGTGRPARLALAIVIDAKYSRRLEERHWDETSKYHEIRDTETGAQVVRQVWIACPGETDRGEMIAFRDTSVGWSAQGPDRPLAAGEFLQGAVSLSPSPVPTAKRGTVCDAAMEFLMGLCSWLGLSESRPIATVHRPRSGGQSTAA